MFYTAVIATVALAFLLLPMCQYLMRPCGKKNKISLGFAGRFTYAELLSVSISILVVWVWIMTGGFFFEELSAFPTKYLLKLFARGRF